MTRRAGGLVLATLALCLAGCVGWRQSYDPAADRLPDATRSAAWLHTAKTARYTVNVMRRVGYRSIVPASQGVTRFNDLARDAILRLKVFEPGKILRDVDRADYHFLFTVRIETTREPGVLSGLIWPFHRARSYLAELAVLDDKGRLLQTYVASAETVQVRHTLLLLLTPFCWPAAAESRAERNLFDALAMKVFLDRRVLAEPPSLAAAANGSIM